MSKVLVVTELVSIVSEKVTETFDVIETRVSPSEGELDDTVGGVVSVVVVVVVSLSVVVDVVEEPSSLLLLQEMTVKLDPEHTTPEQIVAAITSSGYGAEVLEVHSAEPNSIPQDCWFFGWFC